jgi:hypothetical protein
MCDTVSDQICSLNLAKKLRKLRIISEAQYRDVYWAIFFHEFNSETIQQDMQSLKQLRRQIFPEEPSADD